MDESTVALALEAQRGETLARVASMTAELESVATATAGANIDDEHDPEGSTVAFERAQLSSVLEQSRRQLADIEAALVRLARHEYGRCVRCGNAIGTARLEALPAAPLCISCAARRS